MKNNLHAVLNSQVSRCATMLLVGFAVWSAVQESSDGRGIFGRRHRARCCARPPVRYPPPGAPTDYETYQCPIYRAGPAGDNLWMYYSCQWTPNGCGPNPQPMFLSNPNAQGC